MRFLAALLIVFSCTVSAWAQDQPSASIAPERHQSNVPKIVVVVDTSGSMSGPKLADAVDKALRIVMQPTDGLDVAVITFNDAHHWIVPNAEDPWYHLPDGDAVEALDLALTTITGTGNTHPGSALVQALATDAVSVILLTDGVFTSDPTSLILASQRAGGPRLVLFEIGRSTVGRRTLQKLAEDTGAMLWEQELPERPEPKNP